MKKLFVCLFSLFVLSCSVDDDVETTYFEILPIENAIVPDVFERGEIYDIFISYYRPTICHAFNDIYYVRESNERTVAVIATVFQANYDCTELEELLETSFPFKATTEDSYIFKFWQGEDDNGEDQYMVIEVPVVD